MNATNLINTFEEQKFQISKQYEQVAANLQEATKDITIINSLSRIEQMVSTLQELKTKYDFLECAIGEIDKQDAKEQRHNL